jgi:hypothetical protein
MLAKLTHLRSKAPALWVGSYDPSALLGDRLVSIDPIGMAQDLLALPFDALRFQYAGAVTTGLIQRSILASGTLERALDALEKLALGPLARQR